MRKELRWEGGVGRDSFLLRNPGWLLEEQREEFDPGLKVNPTLSTAGQKSISRAEKEVEEAPRAGRAGGKRNPRAVPFPFYTVA